MLKKKILISPVSQFNIFILFHFFFSLFLSMFIYGKKRSFYIFRFFNFHNKIQQIMQCTNLAAFVCEQINIYITALQIVTITTQHKLGITLSLHCNSPRSSGPTVVSFWRFRSRSSCYWSGFVCWQTTSSLVPG